MKDKLKIALYAGEIPSTTFIERLIVGLAQNGQQILLFGRQKKKVMYDSADVKVRAYSDTKWNKFIYLAKYSFLLFFFRKSELKRLNQHIYKNTPNHLVAKRLYYPVLWHKPDVFHLQWTKGTADWTWIGDFGMKLVVSLRGAQINYSPLTEKGLDRIYKQHFPKVDGFHAVSKAIARESEKYGASPEKMKVVYSGFPLKDIPKAEDGYSIQNRKILVLSIGRAHWKKGYNYALDACALLKENGFDFHYTIIGALGVEELEYQKKDLKLQDCVTFLGTVPYESVLKMMQKAHIILLPSVEEGIANVVLEAMMLKKVVVTTNCGGMEEIVTDGQNGFVVPIRNPEAISNKISEIAQLAQNQIAEIVKNAKNTIETTNSEEKMVHDMEALYHFVLNQSTEL